MALSKPELLANAVMVAANIARQSDDGQTVTLRADAWGLIVAYAALVSVWRCLEAECGWSGRLPIVDGRHVDRCPNCGHKGLVTLTES